MRRSSFVCTISPFACENLLSSSISPAGEGFLTTDTPAPTPRFCKSFVFGGRSQNAPTGCGGFLFCKNRIFITFTAKTGRGELCSTTPCPRKPRLVPPCAPQTPRSDLIHRKWISSANADFTAAACRHGGSHPAKQDFIAAACRHGATYEHLFMCS